MDLITAKVEASKMSTANSRKVYINRTQDDECEIGFEPAKNTDDIVTIYINGAQVKDLATHIENLSTFEEPKKENKMIPTKTKPAKKAATKKAKPAAKKLAKAPAKKVDAKAAAPKSKEEKQVRGNNMFLTAAEWKKVDAILDKEDISFSSWSKSLVLAKIK